MCILGDITPANSAASTPTTSSSTSSPATAVSSNTQHSSTARTPPLKPKAKCPYVYRDSPSNYDDHYAQLPDDVAAALISSDDKSSTATKVSMPPPKRKVKTKRGPKRFKGHGWSKSGTKQSRRRLRLASTFPPTKPVGSKRNTPAPTSSSDTS